MKSSLGHDQVPPPPGTWVNNKVVESAKNMPLEQVVKNRPNNRVNFRYKAPKMTKRQRYNFQMNTQKERYNFSGRNVYNQKPNTNEKERNGDKDTSFESHPNRSRIRGQERESYDTPNFDGPMQLAPGPDHENYDIKENRRENNPQRYWEKENYTINFNPNQANHYQNHCQGYGGFYKGSGQEEQNHHNRGLQQHENRKNVMKRNYQVSTIGEAGEINYSEQVINEDGVDVHTSTSYKRKINMKRLKELEKEEELLSMKRKISTRFLLTKAHHRMTVANVEKHLRNNFVVGDVHIRQNPRNHDFYSSFIIIINSDEELDIRNFEEHDWPGDIRCYFAPRDRNPRQ